MEVVDICGNVDFCFVCVFLGEFDVVIFVVVGFFWFGIDLLLCCEEFGLVEWLIVLG